ncbi:MAG: ATP11 protein-domain-containing protein [Benjaminiella poitrasii]|nr:MAG: ATP11 protein-domain-containing protein [Benjaminiella poitrasii]
MIRTFVSLHKSKVPSTFFRQARSAEVVNTPASIFFSNQHNSWARINQIAAEANRVKIDYDAKYALKLKEAALKRGLSSVKELKQFVLTSNTSVKRKASKVTKDAATVASQPEKHEILNKSYGSNTPSLDKIVKLDLLKKEDSESIAKIWVEYHKNKDGIVAVIPVSTYSRMHKVSQKYPLFILPMPRDTGLEFFYVQFQSHQCYITSLLEYKTKGEKARPFLSITHYPELAETKDIVLMRGEIGDKFKKILSPSNAQFLAFALQQFYSQDNPRKLNLVKTFNNAPEKFNYQELIKEMEDIISLH